VIHRLRATVPSDDRVLATPRGPLRILAVSDETDPAFDFERNRHDLKPIDGIIGAGDLRPEYLDFLSEAFKAPLLYVLGNHDRGGGWEESIHHVPEPIDGAWHDLRGLAVAGLSWPSDGKGRAIHDDALAWRQVARCFVKVRARRPDIIVSHAPPQGLGDTPEDHYHRGFAAYRWLCDRLKPSLWIHGHTALAASDGWWLRHGSTTVINATGAVLIEVSPYAQENRATSPESGATIGERSTTDAVSSAATSDGKSETR
jgi:Icc-related predicted phosphoesterase